MARALGIVTLLASLAASVSAAATTVTDDSGAKIVLQAPATRIVSLSPGATEMLFAAGAGDRVIATVEYSDEPPAAKRIPRIGDVMAIDMERLVALHADIAIIWPGGGNAAQIEKITRLGIPLYRQEVDALRDLPQSLRRLGVVAGTSAVAESSARNLEHRLSALERQYARSRRFTVLLQVWNHPIYTVGGTQLMSDALRLCGARNVFDDLKVPGPAVDVEAVIARDPDAIVAAAPRGEAASWLADWKRYPSLQAVKAGRLIAFEDDSFSRLGPSVVSATEALCRVLAQARVR
jgi:iron complex transport system substrate-binding protein